MVYPSYSVRFPIFSSAFLQSELVFDVPKNTTSRPHCQHHAGSHLPNALPLLNDLLDDGKGGIAEKVFAIETDISVDSLLTCPSLSYAPITGASSLIAIVLFRYAGGPCSASSAERYLAVGASLRPGV